MSVRPSIGLYLPGTSVLHKADPRVKLVLALCVATVLFVSESWVMVGAGVALAAGSLAVGKIPLQTAWRIVRPVVWIALFTLVANALVVQPSDVSVVLVGISFSVTGLLRGVLFASRLTTVILITSLVTLTTSPVALADGITLMLSPLRRWRVPVDDIAMMFSIALRFIPIIADEASRIVEAQTARGARFGEGSPYRRVKAWTPVMVPLLIGLFRRADNLALAMEARCYTGKGRTRLRELSLSQGDWVALVGGLTITVLLMTLKIMGYLG